MKKSIIFIGLFLTLGSVYVYQPIAYEILKLKTFDSFVKDQEPSGYFTVLNITEDDITNEVSITKTKACRGAIAVDTEGGFRYWLGNRLPPAR